ncbi:MAG: hypothetical protein Q8908_16035 [Bacteroidota bacterium]|nr:hypothetical protein [Bacteroidota bacterium]
MKSRIFLAGLIAIAIFGMQSCKKNDAGKTGLNASDANLTSNLTAAVAVTAATQLNKAGTADIQTLAVTNFDSLREHHCPDFLGMNGRMMRFNMPRISPCATVTVSGSTFPKTITIDYGTACSTDGRGPKMTGQIIITISDSLKNAGSVKTITYQNFYIDSMKFDYSGSIKNLGKNANGQWVIANNYTQKSVGRNGDEVVENYADTLTWISGFTTADKSDDKYYRTGSGTTSVNDTLKFSRVITKPLLYDNSCGNITSGTIVLTKGSTTITTDFGDGTCDNVATVTTNGSTETINLSDFKFPEGGRFDKHHPGGPGHGQMGPGMGEGMDHRFGF